MDIELPADQEDILSLEFYKDDKELAVWRTNAHLQLFDIATGRLLYDEYTEADRYNKTYMPITEEPDNSRLYFCFTSGQAIVINSESHVKTAFIPFIEIYCKPTNEIWFLGGNRYDTYGDTGGIYKYPAYTYDELIGWAKE